MTADGLAAYGRAVRILFTTFEGGGHVSPMLVVARALKARGATVLVMSDEANRAEAERSGLAFRAWATAPNRQEAGRADDPLTDWRRRWPPALVRSLCEAVITGPSNAYARDALEAMDSFRPDLVVSNELLFGVIAAGEAQRVPVALLSANVWCFPDRPDVPPFGPGWGPARNALEAHRERAGRAMIARWYDMGLSDLNQTRRRLGLPGAVHVLDQLGAVSLRVLGTSAAFDFGQGGQGYVHAGPLLDIHPADRPHPLIDPGRSNVLISFSTTFQDQGSLMRRCAKALSGCGRNVIVTTGPAVSPDVFGDLADTRVAAHAPHDAIVPFCDLVICHGGHGTLMRPLMLGRPVLCLPMGRDHADNGVRLSRRGAGRVLSRRATRGAIRRAAEDLIETPSWRENAEALGARIRRTASEERKAALDALETVANAGR